MAVEMQHKPNIDMQMIKFKGFLINRGAKYHLFLINHVNIWHNVSYFVIIKVYQGMM